MRKKENGWYTVTLDLARIAEIVPAAWSDEDHRSVGDEMAYACMPVPKERYTWNH